LVGGINYQSNEHQKIDRISGNNDSADDVKNVDLTKIHYLSGPFEVETAEPGDVLLVEIMVFRSMHDRDYKEY
jgi:acetamidase/formamidase